MRIQIEGEGTFDVPDDATPDEIAALTQPKASPPPAQKPGVIDSAVTAVGRGAWAPLGMLGLSHAKAQAFYSALTDKSGGDFGERYRRALAANDASEREKQKEHPWATGIGMGVGAAPWAAVAPQVTAGAGASLAARSAAGATNAAGQGFVLGYGDSKAPTTSGRVAEGVMGALSAAPIGALAPGAPVGALAEAEGFVPGPVRAFVSNKLEESARRAAFRAAAKGNAKSEAGKLAKTTGDIGRAEKVGRFLLDEGMLKPTTQPAEIAAAAKSAGADTAKDMRGLTGQVSSIAADVPEASISLTDLIGKNAREALESLAGDGSPVKTVPNGNGGRLVAATEGGDPLQRAAAAALHQDIASIANKYAPRKEILGELGPILERHRDLLDDGADLLADDIKQVVHGWAPGLSDLSAAARKAVKRAAKENDLSPAEANEILGDILGVTDRYRDVRITPDEALNVRQQLDTRVRDWKKTADPNRGAHSSTLNEARRADNKLLGDAMDAAGVGDRWRALNERSGFLQDAQKVANVGAQGDKNRAFGASEHLTGGAFGGMAAHLGGAVAGLPAYAAGALMAHLTKRYGAATAAVMMRRLSARLGTPALQVAPEVKAAIQSRSAPSGELVGLEPLLEFLGRPSPQTLAPAAAEEDRRP